MFRAIFRFYEELNDFLPKHRRKLAFEYTFDGNPSIKDAIEAMGVPHVEVDLILVNNQPVNFNYVLKNEDWISVYPVFESIDISGISPLRKKGLRNTTFVLDVHLGKLAKYLRMAGFDTSYHNNYLDSQIVNISINEHRIILTRDVGLLKLKQVTHGYYIREQDPKKQFLEVIKRFDLYASIAPFSRCINCNGLLENVDKSQIINQLEPLTIKYFDQFYRCTNCNNIYWEGSHYENMKKFIASLSLLT